MYRDLTVAVVVPAYNETGFVGDVIDDLPEFVDQAYVIDDGSTDDTWTEIQEAAARRNETHDGAFDRLVVPIQHEENRGVGGAIKTGYLRACDEEIDATAVLGGDDQMDPEELTKYIDPIVDHDVGYVKGNRFARPEDWAEMPRFRMVGNVILSYLTKIASGYWETMDSQNGYTVISREALEQTEIEGMYEYYGYCNDLLVRLNAADVPIADVSRSSEYAYTEGWKSHIEYKEYIPRVSVMLLRSFLWRLRRKYLLQGYHVLAPLYLIGITSFVTSILGLIRSLWSDESDGGTWALSSLLSVFSVLLAAELDHRDNEDLEMQITDQTEGPSQHGEPSPSRDVEGNDNGSETGFEGSRGRPADPTGPNRTDGGNR